MRKWWPTFQPKERALPDCGCPAHAECRRRVFEAEAMLGAAEMYAVHVWIAGIVVAVTAVCLGGA